MTEQDHQKGSPLMADGYTPDPADVKLVIHAIWDAVEDGGGYPEGARAALAALAAAGRLLPADAEVETLFAFDCGLQAPELHLHHGDERWTRNVAPQVYPDGRRVSKWTAEAPWLPVPNPEGQP